MKKPQPDASFDEFLRFSKDVEELARIPHSAKVAAEAPRHIVVLGGVNHAPGVRNLIERLRELLDSVSDSVEKFSPLLGRLYRPGDEVPPIGECSANSWHEVTISFARTFRAQLGRVVDTEGFVNDRDVDRPFDLSLIETKWPHVCECLRFLDDYDHQGVAVQISRERDEVGRQLPAAGQTKGRRKRDPDVAKREKEIARMLVDGKTHNDIVERYSKDGMNAASSRKIKSRLRQAIRKRLADGATDDDLRKEFGFLDDQTRQQILTAFDLSDET
jgi:hypothetical protein